MFSSFGDDGDEKMTAWDQFISPYKYVSSELNYVKYCKVSYSPASQIGLQYGIFQLYSRYNRHCCLFQNAFPQMF